MAGGKKNKGSIISFAFQKNYCCTVWKLGYSSESGAGNADVSGKDEKEAAFINIRSRTKQNLVNDSIFLRGGV